MKFQGTEFLVFNETIARTGNFIMYTLVLFSRKKFNMI